MALSWQHTSVFDSINSTIDIAQGFNGNGSFGSRINENTNFLKYNLTASYNRYFNRRNNLLLSVNAQYTTSKLPLSEMFIVGGLSSVRGFDQAQELGDKGYTLSAEWFYHPDIKNKYLHNALQLGLFLDNGTASTNKPVPGEKKSITLTGGGTEIIANIEKRYFARVCVGFPINSSVSTEKQTTHIYAFIGAKIW